MLVPGIADIDSDRIRSNVAAIRRRLGLGGAICTPVKANAYGHGVHLVLPILDERGVQQVAVANLVEAIWGRELG